MLALSNTILPFIIVVLILKSSSKSTISASLPAANSPFASDIFNMLTAGVVESIFTAWIYRNIAPHHSFQ